MKISLLNGGLANQTFQYIFARYYQLSHPGQSMYLDDSFFDLEKAHNGYELEKVFGLKPYLLRECFDEDVWEYILIERQKGKSTPQVLWENGMDLTVVSEIDWKTTGMAEFDNKIRFISTNAYEPRILNEYGNVYYNGYWVNKNWFERYKDIFMKELKFPILEDKKNIKYEREILESRSVSIHIRRGDYVDIGMAGSVLDYKMRIEKFEESLKNCPDVVYSGKEKEIKKWKIFVFSDDIPWCKQKAREMGFYSFGDIAFMEGNTEGRNYIDLYLMSLCEGMIMSNSAFCFLAALMNKRKRIVINTTDRAI